jgi:glutathione S-transferase/GST-like protein
VYKLYWAEDSGALAPQIVLEECGADYIRQIVDLDSGEETAEKFLSINPRGQVPALQLDDGTVITESAAIALHIADSYPQAGLLPPLASRERALVYRWLFYAAANLYEGVLRYYYSDRYTSVASQAEQVREAARVYVDSCWDLLENEIGEGPFFLGQSYSVIDPYLLMLSNWHDDADALFERNPKLHRLCKAVRARPAVEAIWSSHFPET